MFSPVSPIAEMSDGCCASISPRIASDVGFLLERQHLGVEHFGPPAIAADDAQEAVGVDLVLELAQEPVEREHQPVRAIGAQPAGIEHRRRRLHRGVHEVGGKLMLAKKAVEGGVPRHPRLDDRRSRPAAAHQRPRDAAHCGCGCGTGRRRRRQQGESRGLCLNMRCQQFNRTRPGVPSSTVADSCSNLRIFDGAGESCRSNVTGAHRGSLVARPHSRRLGAGTLAEAPGAPSPTRPRLGPPAVVGEPASVRRPGVFLGGRVLEHLRIEPSAELQQPRAVAIDLEHDAPAVR